MGYPTGRSGRVGAAAGWYVAVVQTVDAHANTRYQRIWPALFEWIAADGQPTEYGAYRTPNGRERTEYAALHEQLAVVGTRRA